VSISRSSFPQQVLAGTVVPAKPLIVISIRRSARSPWISPYSLKRSSNDVLFAFVEAEQPPAIGAPGIREHRSSKKPQNSHFVRFLRRAGDSISPVHQRGLPFCIPGAAKPKVIFTRIANEPTWRTILKTEVFEIGGHQH
jgi:hypothetical protein